MATRVVKKQELVRQETIQFIRAQTLLLNVSNARPSTRMYVFFGDEDVTGMCAPVGENVGTPIITNPIGDVTIEFHLPAKRFNTGDVTVIVTEAKELDKLEIRGSTAGSCRAVFSANGRMDIIQKTETTIVQIRRPVAVNRDPLAQSFFTYGVKGGMFLTSLDLFFFSKDPEVPIRVEVRPLVNGYPQSGETENPNMVSIVPAEFVQTSTDASKATNVRFDPPIYLKEDGEYCFVVMANTQKYQMFTSRMGEASFEDGRTIFEQPYLGSLFKSENNVTWTAEQFEDIKFTMNRANFDTGVSGKIRYAVDAPYLGISGARFAVEAGSPVVTYTHPQDHGLQVGDKIDIVASSGITVNGISGSALTGAFTVTDVPASNQVKFNVGTLASQTGDLSKCSTVQHVQVLDSGKGYRESDTIQFVGGGGAGAEATLRVNADGSVAGIDLVSAGSGYTSEPQVQIITATGAGAYAVAVCSTSFSVLVNKPFEGFELMMNTVAADDCRVNVNLFTTRGNYIGGNLAQYTADEVMPVTPNFLYSNAYRNLLIASRVNEAAFMSENESLVVEVELSSSNPNVSPFVDARQPQVFKALHRRINNQPGEDLASPRGSASIVGASISAGGSGYTATPTIAVDPPQLPGGVQAVVTVTIDVGVIDSVTITEHGSGYTKTPLARVVPAVGDLTGTGGAVQLTLDTFNTELLPTGGNAKSKYVNRTTRLDLISNGMRLFSTLMSQPGAGVDWYARTSLSSSGEDHDLQPWRAMVCNTPRDKSVHPGDMREYEFRLDNLPEYDTYDLKCVLRATDPTRAPVVKAYRVIALA